MMNDIAALAQAAPAKWDRVHANDLGSAGSIAELNDFVAGSFGTDFRIRIEVDDDAAWWIIRSDSSRPSGSCSPIAPMRDHPAQDELLGRARSPATTAAAVVTTTAAYLATSLPLQSAAIVMTRCRLRSKALLMNNRIAFSAFW